MCVLGLSLLVFNITATEQQVTVTNKFMWKSGLCECRENWQEEELLKPFHRVAFGLEGSRRPLLLFV